MDATLATLVVGAVGVAGTLLGVLLTTRLNERNGRATRERDFELAALDSAVDKLKTLCVIATNRIALPSPIGSLEGMRGFQDLLFADSGILPEQDAVAEVIEICRKAFSSQSAGGLAGTWLLGRRDTAAMNRLVAAENRIATAVRQRRRELVAGPPLPPWWKIWA